MKTDIDLSQTFKTPIAEDYQTALEFISANPDYSLIKFRDITNALCEEVAAHKRIRFKNSNLCDRITLLFDHGSIHKAFKDRLHQTRLLGNDGAHHNELEDISDEGYAESRKKLLIKKAQSARKLIVENFEDTYLILGSGSRISKVRLVKVDDQKYRQILFEAATSSSDQIKLKAGLVYESIADEIGIDSPIYVTEKFKFHQDSLYKMAIEHYEAAYKISANLDQRPVSKNYDDAILEYCKLEPLFRYASLVHGGMLGEDLSSKGKKLIKVAADRGYAPAESFYGACLYQEDDNYEQAKLYLDKSADKNDAMAFRFLFYYYSDGKACPKDKSIALEFLKKGIELGCADSMGTLGQVYHKGELVEQDLDRAEELLKKAIDSGSIMARNYFIVEFKDLNARIEKEINDICEAFKKVTEEKKPKKIVKNKKIGRNSPCTCGSGTKYKQCCLNKNNM